MPKKACTCPGCDRCEPVAGRCGRTAVEGPDQRCQPCVAEAGIKAEPQVPPPRPNGTPGSPAHGGGLDSYGCHQNRWGGSYLCHRGVFRGSMFDSKTRMLQTLEASAPFVVQEFTGLVMGISVSGAILKRAWFQLTFSS